MRSFFCEKCNLEFDLDEDFDEDDNTVFCPQCKINLARILPETPERILMRAKRLEELRRKDRLKLFKLILETVGALLLGAVCMRVMQKAFPMLVCGLIAGIPAGLLTKRLTADRTYRAGILASVLLLLGQGAVFGILLYCGAISAWHPAMRNLAAGVITAFCFAVFEKNS